MLDAETNGHHLLVSE